MVHPPIHLPVRWIVRHIGGRLARRGVDRGLQSRAAASISRSDRIEALNVGDRGRSKKSSPSQAAIRQKLPLEGVATDEALISGLAPAPARTGNRRELHLRSGDTGSKRNAAAPPA